MLRAEKQGEFSQGAVDVPCSNRDHGVAGSHFAKQLLDALLQRGAIGNVLVTGGTNPFRQCRACDSPNGRFAGGVDIRHDQHVRLIEGAAEVVPQVLRARKAVWLKEHQQTVVAAATRGLERGSNFHRMVTVVIDQSNAAHRAFNLKAPSYSREGLKTLANEIGRYVEIKGNRCCCGGVSDIVNARRTG